MAGSVSMNQAVGGRAIAFAGDEIGAVVEAQAWPWRVSKPSKPAVSVPPDGGSAQHQSARSFLESKTVERKGQDSVVYMTQLRITRLQQNKDEIDCESIVIPTQVQSALPVHVPWRRLPVPSLEWTRLAASPTTDRALPGATAVPGQHPHRTGPGAKAGQPGHDFDRPGTPVSS